MIGEWDIICITIHIYITPFTLDSHQRHSEEIAPHYSISQEMELHQTLKRMIYFQTLKASSPTAGEQRTFLPSALDRQ